VSEQATLDALRDLRLEVNLIDEAYWTQRLFEIAEQVDFILRQARGEKWWAQGEAR
jgi:hypothetical protein